MSVLIARTIYVPTLVWDIAICRLNRRLNKWDEIESGLILGAFPLKRDVRRIHAMGIRQVLNMCEERTGPINEYRRLGMNHFRIPVVDFVEPSLQQVKLAIGCIDSSIEGGKPVYAHCKSGRGRSATIVLCWLMQQHGLHPEAAQQQLQKIRGQVRPRLFRSEVVQKFFKELQSRENRTSLPGGHPASSMVNKATPDW